VLSGKSVNAGWIGQPEAARHSLTLIIAIIRLAGWTMQVFPNIDHFGAGLRLVSTDEISSANQRVSAVY
jgi:hypothetical protein